MATRHGAAAVSTAETSDWVQAHAALTRLAFVGARLLMALASGG